MTATTIERKKVSEVDFESLLDSIAKGKEIYQVHFMGLMYGATLFREKRTGKICLQINTVLECYDTNNIGKLRSKLDEVIGKSEALLIFKR